MDLEIIVLKFILSPEKKIRLPEHPGSTLRGAFGHGLYNLCCSLKKNCVTCNLKFNCAFSLLFEPFLTEKEEENSSARFQNKPRPFIIKHALTKQIYDKNENIEFKIILPGKFKQYIPFIVESWRFLQTEGLGAGRGKFKLREVWQINDVKGIAKKVFDYRERKVQNRKIVINDQDIEEYCTFYSGEKEIFINIETPLLLKVDNEYLAKLEFKHLIQNLFRRLSIMTYFYGNKKLDLNFNKYINEAGEIKIVFDNTEWVEWTRFSNRQQRKIKMSGLMGDIGYMGNIDNYLKYLLWGQYLNIGKNTAFAQGSYSLVKQKEGDIFAED